MVSRNPGTPTPYYEQVYLMYLISFNVYNNSEGSYIAITVLQVRKLKPRFMKQFAPGHMAVCGRAGIPGQVSHAHGSLPTPQFWVPLCAPEVASAL